MVLADDMFTIQAARVKRAGEILEEAYNSFIAEMLAKSADPVHSPVKDWVVTVDKSIVARFRGRFIYSYAMQIDNPVFEILSEGTSQGDYPRKASAYGLKAWPIHRPRGVKYGNAPMSAPNSLTLVQAYSKEELIFRPVLKHAIQARNFTRLIHARAQKQINAEGLRVRLELVENN